VTRAASGWDDLERRIVACERCPRLRAWCRKVAKEKRSAFRDETYWGRPVPGFGDRNARVLLVGLAPAAHGANRTGRMFTGDSSGDWLYAALHRAGFANRERSERKGDGLRLVGAYVTATCRCAPPDNKPSREEIEACRPFLDEEFERLDRLTTVVGLGRIAWEAILRRARAIDPGRLEPRRPLFAHGAEARGVIRAGGPEVRILASYHPSRQNTQTGRLTREMLDAVIGRV
jgi:uracil-DNA glycosylase family 4